jgi:hypothetical protein
MLMVTIDQIDGVAVPDDSNFANGIGALQRLSNGLNHIYRQVRGLELVIAAQLAEEDGPDNRIFSYGNDPRIASVPFGMVECFCHWYSVSAVNFVFAVNALDPRLNKPNRKAYRLLLGPVFDFRNKIGAHLAKVMEDERDNDAERILSLTPLVAWGGSRFTTVPFTLRASTNGHAVTSETLAGWSLTEVHEQLSERYPMFTLSQPSPPTRSTAEEA